MIHRYFLAPAAALFLLASSGWAVNPNLQKVDRIYLLPMGNGLDQYLANALARLGDFTIVTDPQAADAVFTDRLGSVFEQRLAEIYPQFADVPEAAGEKTKAEKDEKATPEVRPPNFIASTGRPISSLSRGRGAVFLVDLKSRNVVWSDFRQVKSSQPKEVNKAAKKIVDRIEKDLELLAKTNPMTPVAPPIPAAAPSAPPAAPPAAAPPAAPSPAPAPAQPPPAPAK